MPVALWVVRVHETSRRRSTVRKIQMTNADIDDEGGSGRFFIQENTETPAGSSIESVRNVLVHESIHEIGAPQLSDLWRSFTLVPTFMPLFKVLVWRSISLRYTQSFLGVLWVTIQPVASTLMVFFMFNII